MDLVKVDDCRCFRCGEVLSDLFKYKLAINIVEKAKLVDKFERNVQPVFVNGEWIYRHKKACKKGEGK